MAKYIEVTADTISNIVETNDPDFAAAQGWVPFVEGAQIGYAWVNGAPVFPPVLPNFSALQAVNARSRPVAVRGKVRSLANQGRIAEAMKLLSTIN